MWARALPRLTWRSRTMLCSWGGWLRCNRHAIRAWRRGPSSPWITCERLCLDAGCGLIGIGVQWGCAIADRGEQLWGGGYWRRYWDVDSDGGPSLSCWFDKTDLMTVASWLSGLFARQGKVRLAALQITHVNTVLMWNSNQSNLIFKWFFSRSVLVRDRRIWPSIGCSS